MGKNKPIISKNQRIFPVFDFGGNGCSVEFFLPGNPPIAIDQKPLKKMDKPARLASTISETGNISQESENTALKFAEKALAHIDHLKSQGYNIAEIVAKGTSPFRDAKNGTDVAQKLKDLGIPLEIISKKQEAHYSVNAFLATQPNFTGIFVEMGGGSAQFVKVINGTIQDTKSEALGTLRINAAKRPKHYIKAQLCKHASTFGNTNFPVALAGATYRNAKTIYNAINGPPQEDGDFAFSSAKDVKGTIIGLTMGVTPEALCKYFSVSAKRVTLLRPAGLLLRGMRKHWGISEVGFVDTTMRHGIAMEAIKIIHNEPAIEIDEPKRAA